MSELGGGVGTDIQWAETAGAAKCPTMQSPTTKDCPAPNVHSPEAFLKQILKSHLK